MTKFVIRRAIQAIPVLFGITIVVYGILLAAPGGPTAKFANNPKMTEIQKQKFKEAWGLDQPIPIQYCRWMGFCNPEVSGHRPRLAAHAGGVHRPHRLAKPPADRHQRRLQRRAARGLRLLDQLGREGLRPHRPGGPADVHPGRCRADRLALDRHRPGRLLGDPPLLEVRQRGHRVLVRRLRHAHVLAGHHADLRLRGHAPLAAGQRDDGHAGLAAVRQRQVLGLLREQHDRGDRRHRPPPAAAPDHPRRGQHRRRQPVRAGEHAGVAGPGLRAHGEGEGPAGARRELQARAAECAAAGHHQHRPRDPVPVHGRDRHRDDLLVARDRQAHDRRDPRVRLPDPDGRPARHLDHWSCSRTCSPTSRTASSIPASSTEVRRWPRTSSR